MIPMQGVVITEASLKSIQMCVCDSGQRHKVSNLERNW